MDLRCLQQEEVQTWVKSRWKNPRWTGQISLEINTDWRLVLTLVETQMKRPERPLWPQLFVEAAHLRVTALLVCDSQVHAAMMQAVEELEARAWADQRFWLADAIA